MPHAIDCLSTASLSLITSNKCFVDKSALLAFLNERIDTAHKYICISRPNGFGKTYNANMLCHYYLQSQAFKAKFQDLKIYQDPLLLPPAKRYHTIFLDLERDIVTDEIYKSVDHLIETVTKTVVDDIKELFPKVLIKDPNLLPQCLKDVYNATGKSFIIFVDNYDAILLKSNVSKDEGIRYVEWLHTIFKGQAYLSLAYLTGILPASSFYAPASLDFFFDLSILEPFASAKMVGFSSEEVQDLCQRVEMDFHKLDLRVSSYYIASHDLKVYKPQEIIKAIDSSSSIKALPEAQSAIALESMVAFTTDKTLESLRLLVAGKEVLCKTNYFDFLRLKEGLSLSSNMALTLLVYLGYLTVTKRVDDRTYMLRVVSDEACKNLRKLLTRSLNKGVSSSHLKVAVQQYPKLPVLL